MIRTPNNKGFTLIEMIVTLSIFVLVLLIATNAYVIFNQTQRKVADAQKIQDDVRYLMEVVAQDIRLGRINYSYYATEHIDLHPLVTQTTPVSILALISQSGDMIFYRWVSASQSVQYCKELTPGECDLTAGLGWNDLTPYGVSVADLHFIITPTADPFTELASPIPCAAGSDKSGACATAYGYSCPAAGGNCEYYSDGQHYQPKVRMVIQSVADDPSLPAVSRTLN
ncbi:MAG: prepilin-type N-terminal cleavage/methylation domain-containing protein, partial [Patescibacteria group bacterium]